MTQTQGPKRSVQYVSLGINLAVGMAVFAGLGYYIDQKRGDGQTFTLLGIFLGLFYIGYEIWKLTRSSASDTSSPSNNDPKF